MFNLIKNFILKFIHSDLDKYNDRISELEEKEKVLMEAKTNINVCIKKTDDLCATVKDNTKHLNQVKDLEASHNNLLKLVETNNSAIVDMTKFKEKTLKDLDTLKKLIKEKTDGIADISEKLNVLANSVEELHDIRQEIPKLYEMIEDLQIKIKPSILYKKPELNKESVHENKTEVEEVEEKPKRRVGRPKKK